MPRNVVVIGSQWGDEGKGKIVDRLTESAQAVVRYQGGHNAGHTLVINGKKSILRLIPSGIFHSHIRCYLGNGVVVSLATLKQEIETIEADGLSIRDRLFISPYAPIVMPYHVAIDQAMEKAKGDAAIGTTGRGIGPCYEDKVARRAIRMIDLLDPVTLKQKLSRNVAYHNFILQAYYEEPALDFAEILAEITSYIDLVQPMIQDVPALLEQHRVRGDDILFEGAQGFYLDIDHGTYPYVTSSNTTVACAASGSGFGLRHLNEIVGITKAYTTRVGAGPFITELHDNIGAEIAKRGHEFGSVTGRPRRCGWLDIVALKRAVHINSLTSIALTKLDVLDAFDAVKLCVGYQCGDEKLTSLPMDIQDWDRCVPVYETLAGWNRSTLGVRQLADLPENARRFIERIEVLAGVPITIVSTGPDREDTIIVKDVFSKA